MRIFMSTARMVEDNKDRRQNNIHKAILKGDAEKIHDAIAANRDFINSGDKNGDSPLMYAIYHNKEYMVESLLDEGANINQKDNRGDTPIVIAIAKDHTACLNALLNQNKDIINKNVETFELTPVAYAMTTNNVKSFNTLIEHGADINMLNSNPPKKGGATIAAFLIDAIHKDKNDMAKAIFNECGNKKIDIGDKIVGEIENATKNKNNIYLAKTLNAVSKAKETNIITSDTYTRIAEYINANIKKLNKSLSNSQVAPTPAQRSAPTSISVDTSAATRPSSPSTLHQEAEKYLQKNANVDNYTKQKSERNPNAYIHQFKSKSINGSASTSHQFTSEYNCMRTNDNNQQTFEVMLEVFKQAHPGKLPQITTGMENQDKIIAAVNKVYKDDPNIESIKSNIKSPVSIEPKPPATNDKPAERTTPSP